MNTALKMAISHPVHISVPLICSAPEKFQYNRLINCLSTSVVLRSPSARCCHVRYMSVSYAAKFPCAHPGSLRQVQVLETALETSRSSRPPLLGIHSVLPSSRSTLYLCSPTGPHFIQVLAIRDYDSNAVLFDKSHSIQYCPVSLPPRSVTYPQ